MQTKIESVFHVAPDVFWTRLFFDAEYNAGLYQALGFESYEVQSLQTHADGRIERKLRAEPPLSGPEILKKALRGRIYYVEHGTFDPARQFWEFSNESSVKAGDTRVAGTIRALPHPEGMLHQVELDISVSALGLGSLIEKQIEKSTRESYLVTTTYTNKYAAERGMSFVVGDRSGH